MSVADCEIEEADERICLEHCEPRPCYACYAELADRTYDEERERREGCNDCA